MMAQPPRKLLDHARACPVCSEPKREELVEGMPFGFSSIPSALPVLSPPKGEELHSSRKQRLTNHSAREPSWGIVLSVQPHSWDCTDFRQGRDRSLLHRKAFLLKSCVPATTRTRLMPARISRFFQIIGSETLPWWKMNERLTNRLD